MSVPMRNQGTPLPPNFPYKGEWLDVPRIFLYRPEGERPRTLGKPQFTVEINPTQDDWSFGFDAEQLAIGFGITVDALFAGNRNGDLTLENVESNTPTGEHATAKRYTFRNGGKTVALIIENPGITGTA
jgi:hypothetical protein